MSRVCEKCGKRPVFGHNVSHANNKSRKIWYPNLHTVKVVTKGRSVHMRLCSRCIRSGAVTKV